MEWIQVLSIVLPVVLALVIGFFYNNSRLNDMNKRFDGVDKRFDGVDKRFDGVDKRFDDMNHRIDDLRNDMNERFAIMNSEIREIKNLMMDFLKKEAGYTIKDK